MENTGKNKWQVQLAALGLFALGFLAGALVLNLYHSRQVSASGRGDRGGAPFFRPEKLTEQLKLTPEQAAEVEKIFDDARVQLSEVRKQSEPKFSDIRKQTEERLQQVLTAEQWQQFQQMKSQMQERRGGERRRGRRDSQSKDNQKE
jgi:Spy/CpxP family protein refolding chaperone